MTVEATISHKVPQDEEVKPIAANSTITQRIRKGSRVVGFLVGQKLTKWDICEGQLSEPKTEHVLIGWSKCSNKDRFSPGTAYKLCQARIMTPNRKRVIPNSIQ